MNAGNNEINEYNYNVNFGNIRWTVGWHVMFSFRNDGTRETKAAQ